METVRFVAMEYYALILNRTFQVYACPTGIVGLKVRGFIAASPAHHSREFLDPQSFKDRGMAEKISNIDVCNTDVKKLGSANFRISYCEIQRIDFQKRKKWGMGSVPHSGILNIHGKGGLIKELILLGSQDGQKLLEKIIEVKGHV
jgi:hypothetical protein